MTESEELARGLRATARNAATTALREGLEDIDARHGPRVADEVAALINVAEVYAGLADREVPARGDGDRDDEPWGYRPLRS
ncbi:hypothetical protein ACGFMK_23045 [Amycolatopsis sp. NPDC049252]|uniref:hypothetical protein n=1 Tax=Amycolatopsis sp. NPDC049252 TaxID=3363933 RepID=UPI003722DE69